VRLGPCADNQRPPTLGRVAARLPENRCLPPPPDMVRGRSQCFDPVFVAFHLLASSHTLAFGSVNPLELLLKEFGPHDVGVNFPQLRIRIFASTGIDSTSSSLDASPKMLAAVTATFTRLLGPGVCVAARAVTVRGAAAFEPAEPPPVFLPMLKLNPLFAMGGALSALPGWVDAAVAETSALRLAPTVAALS